jgi:hypothetical protein
MAEATQILRREEGKVRKRRTSTPAIASPLAPASSPPSRPSSRQSSISIDTTASREPATDTYTPSKFMLFLESFLPIWLLEFVRFMTFVVRDTKSGPDELGVINTRQHQDERLDESWQQFCLALFHLPQRHPWLVSQWASLIRPASWFFAGRYINRCDFARGDLIAE